MWTGILFLGLVMGVVTLLTIDIFLPGGFVEGWDSLEVARRPASPRWSSGSCSTPSTPARRRPARSTGYWSTSGSGVVLLAAALQVAVVEVPFLQTAFGTASLDLAHWGVAWPWPPSCSGSMSFESSSGGCGTTGDAAGRSSASRAAR